MIINTGGRTDIVQYYTEWLRAYMRLQTDSTLIFTIPLPPTAKILNRAYRV